MKIAKIGIWLLLPMVFIIGTGMEHNEVVADSNVGEGGFIFKTDRKELDLIKGTAFFSGNISPKNEGDPQVLELFFHVEGVKGDYKMGLTLKKGFNKNSGLLGHYKVDAKSFGYSSNSKGVFGFADIPFFGEQPFYTQTGAVNITYANGELVHGRMELNLENFQEGSIKVVGNFIAGRKEVD